MKSNQQQVEEQAEALLKQATEVNFLLLMLRNELEEKRPSFEKNELPDLKEKMRVIATRLEQARVWANSIQPYLVVKS